MVSPPSAPIPRTGGNNNFTHQRQEDTKKIYTNKLAVTNQPLLTISSHIGALLQFTAPRAPKFLSLIKFVLLVQKV